MTDSYHSDYGSVSKTMLNLFCDSPKLYEETYLKRTLPTKEPTSPMIVGTVLHGVLLEGKKPNELYQVYPDDCLKSNGAINPKPATEFRKSIFPAVAIKEKEAQGIQDAIEAVEASPIADAVAQSTELEKAHYADLYGLPCRCKPDIACDMGDHWLVWDLKFCDPSPAHFFRSAKSFRYFLQDAHYSAVLTAETGKPVVFRFFAFEPVYPFRLQAYWYEPRQREIAQDFHRTKIADLRKCMATGDWSDKWSNAIPLNEWHLDPNGEAPLDWSEVEPEAAEVV